MAELISNSILRGKFFYFDFTFETLKSYFDLQLTVSRWLDSQFSASMRRVNFTICSKITKSTFENASLVSESSPAESCCFAGCWEVLNGCGLSKAKTFKRNREKTEKWKYFWKNCEIFESQVFFNKNCVYERLWSSFGSNL